MSFTKYLVTDDLADIQCIQQQIVMINGTINNWQSRDFDRQFNTRRAGSEQLTSCMEILEKDPFDDDYYFVTTAVNPSACATAALLYLINDQKIAVSLSGERFDAAKGWLSALCLEDQLFGCSQSSGWLTSEVAIAKDRIASLQVCFEQTSAEMGFPSNSALWDKAMCKAYQTECFRRGTEQILCSIFFEDNHMQGCPNVDNSYWKQIYELESYVNNCARMIDRCGVLDQRSLRKYCDPRLLVEWVRGQADHENFVLLVKDSSIQFSDRAIRNYRYVLQSVPFHKSGPPHFSTSRIWVALTEAEKMRRETLGMSHALTPWQGNEERGNSSWSCNSILSPKEVVKLVSDLAQPVFIKT
jgi:hypothetical protein